MRFNEVLSVLSKSSPYAVSTERDESISQALDEIKSYLYVKTDIEDDFRKHLTNLSSTDKRIIFLCGSSGDGKSEILTRYSKEYSGVAKFHLDATHSFDPNTNAIQTLDKLFTEFESETRPLVVGINIGMLGNYAQEGCCEAVKASITQYLEYGKYLDNHIFLNFEDYPKFILEKEGNSSQFIQQIFNKITALEDNIIRKYFEEEVSRPDSDKKLCANYRLLSIPGVQSRIIDILFKARLMKDQFLTARTLLDFVHTLLLGTGGQKDNGYLFDNLFSGSDNELSAKILDFDPANYRTNHIDKFVLSYSLGLPDDDFNAFTTFLSSELGIRKPNKPKPASYLRLFYLLKGTKLSNNYHAKFEEDFTERLLDQYSEMWNLHNYYSGDKSEKNAIRSFYKEIVIASIQKYSNRNADNLDKNQFLISEHNGYQVVTEIELKPDLESIKSNSTHTPSYFDLRLKLNGQDIKLPLSINLLQLMKRIVKGYRPNRHDKNTVVLLDELVDKIKELASKSNTIEIIHGRNRYKVTNVDDEDIEVSGV